MAEKVKHDYRIAEDILEDHNKIEGLLFLHYAIKTLTLVVLIVNVSYFFGMTWMILCVINSEYFDPLVAGEPEPVNFINKFGIEDETSEDKVRSSIKLLYFAFTSLSTVGFGDYYPFASIERLVAAFMLLFGVAIFSYIMGVFIDILDNFTKLTEELDEGDELSMFFHVMTKFNGGRRLS